MNHQPPCFDRLRRSLRQRLYRFMICSVRFSASGSGWSCLGATFAKSAPNVWVSVAVRSAQDFEVQVHIVVAKYSSDVWKHSTVA